MQFLKSTYNKEMLQQILDCFTELTGIRVAYFSETGEIITGQDKHICSFCSEIRDYPELLEGCLTSDRNAFKKAREQKSMYLYKCHMGLWEAVVPLYINDCYVGGLMLGQVRDEKEGSLIWGHIISRLDMLKIPKSKQEIIKSTYIDIQGFNSDKIKAAAKMLDIITSYITDSEIVFICDMQAIQKTRKYIEENFRMRLSLKDLAEMAGLSTSYFSYLFHKETGLTVSAYIEKKRIGFAKEQLLVTSFSIKEIASMTGFDDQNYFSRLFKKHTALSPVQYRLKYKRHI